MRLPYFAFGLSVLAAACTPSSDGESRADDLSGTVSSARVCALKKAYMEADLDAFETVLKGELPATITTSSPVSITRLDVAASFVYVIEEATTTSFYDPYGTLVARMTNASLAWTTPAGGPISCTAANEIVSGDDAKLLGIAGNDAIYSLPTDGSAKAIWAVPLTGGAPTALFDLAAGDDLKIENGVVGHWHDTAYDTGRLDLWTRQRGLETDVATSSLVGLLNASEDGSRIAYSEGVIVSAGRLSTTKLVVSDLEGSTTFTFDATPDISRPSCAPRHSFTKSTFFAQFCVPGEQNAQLHVVEQSFAHARIDGVGPGQVDPAMAFSTNGTQIVYPELSGGRHGVVYNVATATKRTLPEQTKYTMLADGTVLYQNAAKDLIADRGTPRTVATGVREILGVGSRAVLFSRNPRDMYSGLVDVNIADLLSTPSRLLTDRGLPLGFTSDGRTAFYFVAGPLNVDGSVMAVPIGGGNARELARKAAGGVPDPNGDGIVVFSDPTTPDGLGGPTFARADYVNARTGRSIALSKRAPIGKFDFQLFFANHYVAYTEKASGSEGIYGVALP